MESAVKATVKPPFPVANFVWMPGPANGRDPCEKDLVEVGDKFIVLIHCVTQGKPCSDYWDVHVITATETGWDDADGDSWGTWEWTDVSWYAEMTKEKYPPLTI